MKKVRGDILIGEKTSEGAAGLSEEWRAEIDRVLSRRGWRMVADRDQFAQAVCNELESRSGGARRPVTAEALRRATVHRYCFVLYDACGSTDRRLQRVAFGELWDHLYRVAVFKAHDSEKAKDAAQQALINIWRHRDQCRDNGSFLNWCNLVVLNAVREQFRKELRQARRGGRLNTGELEIPPPVVANPDEVLGEGSAADSDPTGETQGYRQVVQGELRAQLIAAIRACLKNESQQKVIVESFLEDRTVKELADELHMRPGNIQVMKSRAFKTLRQCEPFVRLYEEWLNVSAPSHS